MIASKHNKWSWQIEQTGRDWIGSKLHSVVWGSLAGDRALTGSAQSSVSFESYCKQMYCFTSWRGTFGTSNEGKTSMEYRQCWLSSEWRSSRSVGKATKGCSCIWYTVTWNPPRKAPASPRCPEAYDQQETLTELVVKLAVSNHLWSNSTIQ